MKWKTFYDQGGIVIADRYTTSNMLYQMIKIDDASLRKSYLDWLEDFEFHKMGLPEPDAVFLLDVPLDVTLGLMADRVGKTGGETGDIHEKTDSSWLNATPLTTNWRFATVGRELPAPKAESSGRLKPFMMTYTNLFWIPESRLPREPLR